LPHRPFTCYGFIEDPQITFYDPVELKTDLFQALSDSIHFNFSNSTIGEVEVLKMQNNSIALTLF